MTDKDEFMKRMEGSKDNPEIPMYHFGHLKSVDLKKSPQPGKVQLIFDTGVEMYIPEKLFVALNLRFKLEEI